MFLAKFCTNNNLKFWLAFSEKISLDLMVLYTLTIDLVEFSHSGSSLFAVVEMIS